MDTLQFRDQGTTLNPEMLGVNTKTYTYGPRGRGYNRPSSQNTGICHHKKRKKSKKIWNA